MGMRKFRWKNLLVLGIVAGVFAVTVPAQAGEPSISVRVVEQDINAQDQYVYDGTNTDTTMSTLAIPKSSTGALGYINNGVVQKNSGSVLISNWDGWWHMKAGWKQNTNGLTQLSDNGWYMFSNGRLQVTENATARNTATNWMYLEDGKAKTSYTGLVQNENGIFWVSNGIVSSTYTDIVKDTIGVTPDAGWLYIVNGKFDSTADTVAKNVNGWWKIRDGLVDFEYNGLAKNDNGWWYISGGAVNFNYNGAVQNEKGIWYVSGGKVNFDFNGAAYGYYFEGGCAQ